MKILSVQIQGSGYSINGGSYTTGVSGSGIDIALQKWLESNEPDLEPEPVLNPAQVRDAAFTALTHDLGGGRIIQCRPHPFSDESNMRNAIDQMSRLGQSNRPWYMANNTTALVTPADLQAALEAGQDGSSLIWAEFFTAIDG